MKHFIKLVLIAGFTLSSCNPTPSGDHLKSEMDQLKSKTNDQQKALQELSTQVRALNEENNRLKSLMSQLTDGVIAQKQTLQNLSQTPTPKPVPAPKTTIRSNSRPNSRPTPRFTPKSSRKSTASQKNTRPTSKPSPSKSSTKTRR
jgi:peptidoglycan hydrolase CwlO-like protein